MKIHLISDVHLEFKKVMPSVTASGDVCVCAGDIGLLTNPRTLKFWFKTLFDNFDHVIWVLGNHEYYDSKYAKALEVAHEIEYDLAQEHSFHLLDIHGDPSVTLNGVKFWGSTLWTGINEENIAGEVTRGLNDYWCIRDGSHSISIEHTNFWNYKTLEEIDWSADVIITHHAPYYIKHKNFEYSPIAHAFYNFSRILMEKIEAWPGKYWLFGHTHHSLVDEVNGTLVCNNTYGYNFQENAGYDPNFYIEVNELDILARQAQELGLL